MLRRDVHADDVGEISRWCDYKDCPRMRTLGPAGKLGFTTPKLAVDDEGSQEEDAVAAGDRRDHHSTQTIEL